MKKILSTVFLVILLLVLVLAVAAAPAAAADRENLSVGRLTITKDIVGAAYCSVSKVMVAVTDWTLTKAQALCKYIDLTASGSGDSVIVPTAFLRANDEKVVRNGTDSTVTFKKYGGTGVSIASGKTATIRYNGSDYVRVTADATH